MSKVHVILFLKKRSEVT